MSNIHHLLTANEAEEILGKKYFYRQRIYRFAESKKLPEFKRDENAVYLGSHVVQAFLKELELRIQNKFPQIDITILRIFFDNINGKRVIVDGLFGRKISVNTDEENEEDLLKKIDTVIEWIGEDKNLYLEVPRTTDENIRLIEQWTEEDEKVQLTEVLPEEIFWIRVNTNVISDVEIKSYILISLPSVAQFIGIRPDLLNEWVSKTTFSSFILSAHYKQIQGTEISVPWKKGVVSGYTPFIPFELIPEVIVAFRQSSRTVSYPEKAEMLYTLAKNTLQAVGIAISGDKDKAAEELSKIGKRLGISQAEQIIQIFRQYESREFQVQTTKIFSSKVKALKMDYPETIGKLTFGITGRWPTQWKLLGTMKKLPKQITGSSRDVMRSISPSDSVGMTFGEKDFINNENIDEAIETGEQGKAFHERLIKVGILKDPTENDIKKLES